MYSIEKETLRDRTKGMTEEEQRFIVQFIPQEILESELKRREIVTDQKIMAVSRILNWMNEQEYNLETKTTFLKSVKAVI